MGTGLSQKGNGMPKEAKPLGYHIEPLCVEPLEDILEEIAHCMVEEFIRRGLNYQQILEIFRNPLSGGPYSFYRARGEKWIREFIAQISQKGFSSGTGVKEVEHEGR
ncbi:MAG: hypothetical protein ACK4K2_01605 [Dehalococcoidia bacterium]